MQAIHHYLTFQYIPDPLTPFIGIHKLPPAHFLVWEEGRTRIQRYWDLEYEPKWDLPAGELEQRVREAVTEAVRTPFGERRAPGCVSERWDRL